MSAIGTTSSLAADTVREPTRGFGEISSEDFVGLMLSELTNQDPLEPNDTEQMLSQISTIRAIESDEAMLDSLDAMVDSNQFASAANLIGTLVSGLTESGDRAIDVVLSVSNTDDGPVLNLFDGSRVPMKNVDEVVAPLNPGGDDPDDAADSSIYRGVV